MLVEPIQQFTSLWRGICGSFVIQRVWFGVLSPISIPARMSFPRAGVCAFRLYQLFTSMWDIRSCGYHMIRGVWGARMWPTQQPTRESGSEQRTQIQIGGWGTKLLVLSVNSWFQVRSRCFLARAVFKYLLQWSGLAREDASGWEGIKDGCLVIFCKYICKSQS